jgi:aspartate/glutamate racemase
MNSQMRKIGGVLGGMGPLATVDFLQKVIAHEQAHSTPSSHVIPRTTGT